MKTMREVALENKRHVRLTPYQIGREVERVHSDKRGYAVFVMPWEAWLADLDSFTAEIVDGLSFSGDPPEGESWATLHECLMDRYTHDGCVIAVCGCYDISTDIYKLSVHLGRP